jgi:hypothetical protein
VLNLGAKAGGESAFDSGTDYYRENAHQFYGVGAEIELSKDTGPQMNMMRGAGVIDRKMVKEGVNEYVFENVVPGDYNVRHTFLQLYYESRLWISLFYTINFLIQLF